MHLSLSHNAPFCNRNLLMCAHFCHKWCIVGYSPDELWDLWDGSLAGTCYMESVKSVTSMITRAYVTSCMATFYISFIRVVHSMGSRDATWRHSAQSSLVPVIACNMVGTKPWSTPRAWWRHQMEIFSALLAICAGNSPVPGEFPAQRPVTRSFDVFFDLCLNKRLRK